MSEAGCDKTPLRIINGHCHKALAGDGWDGGVWDGLESAALSPGGRSL